MDDAEQLLELDRLPHGGSGIDRLRLAWIRPASSREKSSRVLTSLSSRRALRWARATCSCRTAGSGSERAASASSSGPSIRVSGVRNSWLTFAEEDRFCPVYLCQRLGALAFRLVGARVGHGGRQPGGEQLVECPVRLVQELADLERLPRVHHLVKWPAAALRRRDWHRGWAGRRARSEHRPRGETGLVALKHVEQHEREIEGAVRERLRCEPRSCPSGPPCRLPPSTIGLGPRS